MDLQKDITTLETALTQASENEVKTVKLLEQARERRAFIAGQLTVLKNLARQQIAEKQQAQTLEDEKQPEEEPMEARAGI
jgi:multidrug efflux pump subunit AcrA (membrane-fusion protein)